MLWLVTLPQFTVSDHNLRCLIGTTLHLGSGELAVNICGNGPVHTLHFFCAREANETNSIALTRSKNRICTVGDYEADLELVHL